MMGAAELGFVEVVRLLIAHKADVNATNHKGRTAMSFAAAPSAHRRSQLEAMKELINHKADTSIIDKRGNTALALADWERKIGVHESRSEAVNLLMSLTR